MADNHPRSEKFFVGKKFFLHVTRPANKDRFDKSAELIKTFGGQIEQFLDNEVAYVLTDVPGNEWPPNGQDSMLIRALKYQVKLMNLNKLLFFCSKYISSPSSSDDDDDNGTNIRDLKAPFIKHEDSLGRFAPSVKEFVKWPEINIDSSLPVGRSFFSDPSFLVTPNHSANNINHPNNSAQLTQQASLRTINPTNITSTATNNQPPLIVSFNNINGIGPKFQNTFSSARNNTQPNNNVTPRLGVRRRHSVYCEVCNQKIDEKIEDHIQTNNHKINTDKMCWAEVNLVIESLPSLNTLDKRRLTNLTPPKGKEFAEFICLHNVDSVSSLFHTPIRS